MSISQTIKAFADLAIKSGGWKELDRVYLENRILGMIGEDALDSTEQHDTVAGLDLIDALMTQAKDNNVIGSLQADYDILEAQLTDLLTPSPSAVNEQFYQLYSDSPTAATDYFYQLCKNNNYIKTKAIAQNIVFPTESDYGTLEITINLSRPEKDPKQIAAERNSLSVDYPKCLLCMENEGYRGRINHPARTNHRIIRMSVNGEPWGFQYSPYAYYNEHAIILSEEHRPMKISKETFQRLLNITEVLPHYFVGSNADLPIVGGSILSHDHYQGGRHTFAMAEAEIEAPFVLNGFETIRAGIVKWPMSVIRLQGTRVDELTEAADLILDKWRNYSDETVQVSAYSEDGTPHHTVTPIARRNGELFELDLVLRDNNTSEEYPDGIFHPHKDVHHIKKENIGLIEVMGLAVLPPRLANELKEVEQFLLDQEHDMADHHKEWAEQLKATQPITEETVSTIIHEAVGKVFERVLVDAGVFKRDTQGQQAFQRFIDYLQ
ncbi:UDP-glucose--hexose-1-phosphate uridylyltransferase [Candidatus Enterococcus clewellii]|uniref:Galactose-1-phosphate uridylyltransferase n=1 Tax=Candidatus Enterococcus clewellii TaxID=1834193 RepID=A0A242KDE8_9ENTE|nr:UDP-glucose--hexose-1-phosphate uridylyltransferase [Enterococcus sp. 9E7_DIV0242]OTP19193.1 galactose-1-phosphate uridylyltransferase [Enterococcus sp. 9E7_DIV0242]